MADAVRSQWRILPGGVTHDAALLRVQAPRDTARTHPPPELQLEPQAPPGATLTLMSDSSSAEHTVRITGLQPDTAYHIAVAAAGVTLASDAWIRTAPARIADGAGLLLGITSCYFPSENFGGIPQRVEDCLLARDFRPAGAPRPDAGIGGRLPAAFFHLGDQIYADLAGSFARSADRLFPERYEESWAPERLGAVLRLGGHFFTPDDHEYWNGFPAPMFWLPPTVGDGWEPAACVARQALWREQGRWNFVPDFAGGEAEEVGWGSGSLGEVPFFITDCRSDRTGPTGKRRPEDLARRRSATSREPSLFSSRQREALLDWLKHLDPVGLLVLSQPLLASGSKRLDAGLEHYPKDYRALLEGLRSAVGAGKTLIVLTGDIHQGRLTRFVPGNGGRGQLIEFVVSPLARIGSGFFQKVGNLMNESSRVGAAKDVESTAELAASPAARRLRDAWPELSHHCHFATSENQLGLVHLFVDPAGQRVARFEIWDLWEKRLATNAWSPLRTCQHDIVLD